MSFNINNSRPFAFAVLGAIFLQTISTMSVAYGSSSYYVIAFERRGVEGYLVGLFSFGPGLGVIIGFFFDTTHYLIHQRKLNVSLVVCLALIATILICAATGLCALISSNNSALILMIILRVLFGFLELRLCEIAVECCKVWFPAHFRVVQGVTNGGYYLGAALFNQLSGVMYDSWSNFTTPYMAFAIIVCACLVFNAVVLPDNSEIETDKYDQVDDDPSDTLLANQLKYEKISYDIEQITWKPAEKKKKVALSSEEEDKIGQEADCGLSPMIILPMVGDICFDMMYGYAAALVVPYLNTVFAVPITTASFFLVLLNLSMMVGSSVSGAILQAQLISSPKMAVLGAFFGFVGAWLLFPAVKIPGLFDKVPYVGYLAICLIGFASQFGSVASYKTMEAVQAKVTGRSLSVNLRSRITTVWYTGVATAMYAGSTVAVLASRYLTLEQGNGFLLTWMVVALGLNMVVIVFLGRSKARHS